MRSHEGVSKGRRIPELEAVPAMMKRHVSERERRLRKEMRHLRLAERYDDDLTLCPAGADLD